MEKQQQRDRSGPKAWFRPKADPMSVAFSEDGREILDGIAARSRASRADVLETLVRKSKHATLRRPQ